MQVKHNQANHNTAEQINTQPIKRNTHNISMSTQKHNTATQAQSNQHKAKQIKSQRSKRKQTKLNKQNQQHKQANSINHNKPNTTKNN